jgi:hypothetical protein
LEKGRARLRVDQLQALAAFFEMTLAGVMRGVDEPHVEQGG